MKILLMSMRVTESVNYKEERNSIAYDYISFFEEMGYLIILLPNNSKNIKEYFNQKIDLVVLSGGNNVDPTLYNNSSLLDDVYTKRDESEQELLELSIEKKIKVLGICRGFHFINIYFGGKLLHNIKNHVNKTHLLKSSIKLLHNEKTNSFHNQGIREEVLAINLIPIAKTDDGFVYAFINKNQTILGIQWHPERQDKLFDKKLIKTFTEGKL